MRRLRHSRPETVLRKLNRSIRSLEGDVLEATRRRDYREEGLRRAALVALQGFRERAYGLRLRSYQANKPLFQKGKP